MTTKNATDKPASVNPTSSSAHVPKTQILDQFTDAILELHSQNMLMRDIAAALAEPPYSINVTRQAVQTWIKFKLNPSARRLPVGSRDSKPGPKGKVLDPYEQELLSMFRKGWSMPEIVQWLAEPERDVRVSRQSVSVWIKSRIARLAERQAMLKGVELDDVVVVKTLVSHRVRQVAAGKPAPATAPVLTESSAKAGATTAGRPDSAAASLPVRSAVRAIGPLSASQPEARGGLQLKPTPGSVKDPSKREE